MVSLDEHEETMEVVKRARIETARPGITQHGALHQKETTVIANIAYRQRVQAVGLSAADMNRNLWLMFVLN